jgi:hypothetical protein
MNSKTKKGKKGEGEEEERQEEKKWDGKIRLSLISIFNRRAPPLFSSHLNEFELCRINQSI